MENTATYIPLIKDTKDAHYRYKMPKLTAKVEGSGNGIKTVLTNMTAVAKALHRPASYPTKYFGCELGAQVQMGQDFVVNGAHDAEKLLSLLYVFINKFVLCSKCKNPETELKVDNRRIMQKCIACGHETTIPNTHRLTTYIINHPPNEDTSSKKSTRKDKNGKSKKHNGTRSPTSDGKKNVHDNSNNNLDGNDLDNNNDFDDFDDDFGDSNDLNNDENSNTLQNLTDSLKNTQVDDPFEKANAFLKMINEKKDQLNDASVQKQLVSESKNLGIGDKSTLLLSEALFTDNICEQIKQYRPLLLRFCLENKKAQKYLLGGFEKLVGEIYQEKLLSKVATILKTFYDNDILEEEVILEWSDKPSKKYVSKDISKMIHEKAGPFIKWLKEAEIEDDSEEDNDETKSKEKSNQNNNEHDEEDDDDDIDIEYSHRVSGLVAVENKENDAGGDGEDINIDDI